MTRNLCGVCRAKMADAYDLTQISFAVDEKVKCDVCGRKRYGHEYELVKRKKAKR